MNKPLPVSVLISTPGVGGWIASVTVEERGSGTAWGDSAGQAFEHALMIALATGPEHTEDRVQ